MADQTQDVDGVTEEPVDLLSGYPLLGIVIGATVCGLVLIMLIVLTILLLLRRSGCLRSGKLKVRNGDTEAAKKKLLATQVQSVSDTELQKLSKAPNGNHQQAQVGDKKAHNEDQVPLIVTDLPSPPDPADKSLVDNSNRNSWVGRNTSFRLAQEDRDKVIQKLRRPNGATIGEEHDGLPQSSSPVQDTTQVNFSREQTKIQNGLVTPASSRQSASSLNAPGHSTTTSTREQSLSSPSIGLETPPGSQYMSGISSPTSPVYQPTVISLMACAASPKMEPFKITDLKSEPKPPRYSGCEPKLSTQLELSETTPQGQLELSEPEPRTQPLSNESSLLKASSLEVEPPKRMISNTTDSAVAADSGDMVLTPSEPTVPSVTPQTSSPSPDSTPETAPPARPNKLKIPPPTLPKPKNRPGSSRRSSINSNAGHYDIPRIHPMPAQNTDNVTPSKPSPNYQMPRHSAASTPAQSPSIPPWEKSGTKIAPWDRHAASPSRSGKARFTPAFVLDGEVVKRAAQKSMSLQAHQSGRVTFTPQNTNIRATVSEDSPSPLYNYQREGQPKKVATVKPNSSIKHSSYQSFIEHLQTQYGTTAPSHGNVQVIPPTVDNIEDEKAKSAAIDAAKIHNENKTAES